MLYRPAAATGGKAQIHGERPAVQVGEPASLLYGCVTGPCAVEVMATSCCLCCKQGSDQLYPEIQWPLGLYQNSPYSHEHTSLPLQGTGG